MLSTIVIGDPHFKTSNVTETTIMVNEILTLTQKKKPTFIVVLGDVLDRHETIHVNPLTRAIKFLKELRAIAPVYILIGNHDRPSDKTFCTEESPFAACKEWSSTYVIDRPLSAEIKGELFVFVPYVPPGRFQEALDLLSLNRKPQCIFAHQEFRGAKMGAIISTLGDEWHLDNPLVISGHIHDYDWPQHNIFYPGTPIQHAFGDTTKKGIFYCTYHPFSFEHLSLKGVPRRFIRHLTLDECKTFQPEPNCFYKIVIEVNVAEATLLRKDPIFLQLKKDPHIRIVLKVSHMEVPASTQDVSRRTFRYILDSYLQKDPILRCTFERLFGSVLIKENKSHIVII